jgi:hypothetical protein
VKTKTIPASNAALSLVPANEAQTLNAEFPGDFQDLCSLALDQAIGIEKASLTTVVRLNSSVIDIYKNAFWFAPVFGDLLDTAAKSFAFCIELQMNWLTMLVPHANEESETLLRVAAPDSTLVSSAGSQAAPTAEELAHSMDIATGAQFEVPSHTVVQAQPTAEVSESDLDSAIGARAA